MDIFFDISDGTFEIERDEEDIAETDRERCELVLRSMTWPVLTLGPVKEGSTTDSGKSYNHVILVDEIEGHVASTMPEEATRKVLRGICTSLNNKAKAGDEDDAVDTVEAEVVEDDSI